MKPKDREGSPARPPLDAANDYMTKVSQETSRLGRRMKQAGHPQPLGEPASGIMIVLEQSVGPRVIDALARSLESVGLPDAYVTWTGTGLLLEEILSAEPAVLVAVGPEAAREVDTLEYPLVRRLFSEATEGVWFTWTRTIAGLLLPSLSPAIYNDEAKKRFWRAFLALRELASLP